jgi:surface antigen
VKNMASSKTLQRIFMALVISIFLTSTVWSKPPPWAPAHGYRNKHKQHEYHDGYAKDLEIFDGRCIYEKAGTVIGGVVGGVLGSKVGDGDGRKIAIIAGTILGAIIGKKVGARFDEKDRFCTGQTLEHAKNGQAVAWNNPETNTKYVVTPLNSYQQGDTLCRQFNIETVTANGNSSNIYNDACRDANMVWSTLY